MSKSQLIDKDELGVLTRAAWRHHGKAQIRMSGTKVGCAIRGSNGGLYVGYNIEGQWATSIHAEVVAISQLAGSGEAGSIIVITAGVSHFTPCGACLDWLYQFCERDAVIGFVSGEGLQFESKLRDLYPDYPTR